jgi:DNA-binding transcriptional regulator YhcF (GntR family)
VKKFWAIPQEIAKRKDLSLKAKLLAGVLWSMKNSNLEAFPSRGYLAEALGTSLSTIDRALKELVAKTGLRIKRRGFGKSNCYHIPNWQESSEMITQEASGLTNLEDTRLKSHESSGVTTIIDNSNKYFNKYNTKVDAKASSLDVIDYFKRRVKELKGFYPEIDYGKDGRLAKERLKKYSFEEIANLIDWYLNSENFEKFGASLSICLSNFIINLWKASKFGQRSISNLYPLWQGGS